MVGRLIQSTKSAYQYPLIFKQLWHTPLFVDSIPRTSVGKVNKKELRERYGDM